MLTADCCFKGTDGYCGFSVALVSWVCCVFINVSTSLWEWETGLCENGVVLYKETRQIKDKCLPRMLVWIWRRKTFFFLTIQFFSLKPSWFTAARNHVNRMCLAADIPLIESGTAGYLGQVTVIKKVRWGVTLVIGYFRQQGVGVWR